MIAQARRDCKPAFLPCLFSAGGWHKKGEYDKMIRKSAFVIFRVSGTLQALR